MRKKIDVGKQVTKEFTEGVNSSAESMNLKMGMRTQIIAERDLQSPDMSPDANYN